LGGVPQETLLGPTRSTVSPAVWPGLLLAQSTTFVSKNIRGWGPQRQMAGRQKRETPVSLTFPPPPPLPATELAVIASIVSRQRALRPWLVGRGAPARRASLIIHAVTEFCDYDGNDGATHQERVYVGLPPASSSYVRVASTW